MASDARRFSQPEGNGPADRTQAEPGDVCREESDRETAAQDCPKESALGKGDGGLGGKGNTSRVSSDRMAAAGRARCDEGSYGHRQQR